MLQISLWAEKTKIKVPKNTKRKILNMADILRLYIAMVKLSNQMHVYKIE